MGLGVCVFNYTIRLGGLQGLFRFRPVKAVLERKKQGGFAALFKKRIKRLTINSIRCRKCRSKRNFYFDRC